MSDPTKGAAEALDAFQRAAGTSGDDSSDIRDLLTAIAHWLEQRGDHPHERFDAALEVFVEEASP